MSGATGHRLDAVTSRRDVRLLVLAVAAELLLVAVHFRVRPGEPTSLRYVLYPFVWINLGVLAAVKTPPPNASRQREAVALVLAVAYFAVLATVGGLVGLTGDPQGPLGTRFAVRSPGWGPVLSYVSPSFYVTFVPYLAVGYLSLSYLLYVATTKALSATALGGLGLIACVGCSLPVLTTLAAGVAGSAGAAAAYAHSVDIATAAFVVTVALLYWRPGIE
ncbi:DUF7546 family protein [Halostella pelagica]|uniref:DUF7546 family protein n=1 Tax=Halostella pelagica TaxID=2583824 RepID=UPI00108010B8|nr:hypothetical protein [Halostella pelagica]